MLERSVQTEAPSRRQRRSTRCLNRIMSKSRQDKEAEAVEPRGRRLTRRTIYMLYSPAYADDRTRSMLNTYNSDELLLSSGKLRPGSSELVLGGSELRLAGRRLLVGAAARLATIEGEMCVVRVAATVACAFRRRECYW